jgi:hypothetical protein
MEARFSLAGGGALWRACPRSRSQVSGRRTQLVEDLVVANRVLSDQGVLDGFGHLRCATTRTPAAI